MDDREIRRLAWACRRGMLELDMYLGLFLDNNFQTLGPAAQQKFKELLEQSDPELYAWLIDHKTPPDDFKDLIDAIKAER